MRTILLIIAIVAFNGCSLHDDVSPEKARTMTTSELQYIYGSYRQYAYKLPNIQAELIRRGEL